MPEVPGLYVWWVRGGALSTVPAPAHPDHPELRALYVGIAPESDESSATLRSRLLKNHLGSSLASSTFRRRLAALLWKEQGWSPRLTAGGRWRFDTADDQALRTWQRTNLRVSWCPLDKPWEREALAIETLRTPLNVNANVTNPYLDKLEAARKAFKAATAQAGADGRLP